MLASRAAVTTSARALRRLAPPAAVRMASTQVRGRGIYCLWCVGFPAKRPVGHQVVRERRRRQIFDERIALDNVNEDRMRVCQRGCVSCIRSPQSVLVGLHCDHIVFICHFQSPRPYEGTSSNSGCCYIKAHDI